MRSTMMIGMDAQDAREQAFRERAEQRPWFLRRARWWVGPLVVLAAIAGLYAWQALQPDERATAQIENELEKWADENTEGGGKISVQCPDPIEWRVGETFHCIVEQDGQSVSVTVSMENEAGDVTWRTE